MALAVQVHNPGLSDTSVGESLMPWGLVKHRDDSWLEVVNFDNHISLAELRWD